MKPFQHVCGARLVCAEGKTRREKAGRAATAAGTAGGEAFGLRAESALEKRTGFGFNRRPHG
ncbi:MAG: hypothetical protein ACOC98_09190 [Thermodesulfobacteriota bacterium]